MISQDKRKRRTSSIKFVDPISDTVDQSLDWLEFTKIPDNIRNPLMDYTFDDPARDTVKILMDENYLHFACRTLLGIELLPFQTIILDTLWRKRLPMFIATRGAGKSFLLAVYALLRMIFHPGCKIAITGSGFRQSKIIFDYMADIWNSSSILQDIAGNDVSQGPRREIDKCQFNLGNSKCMALPIGTGDKIRGLRANYILADEMASINEEIFNIVIQGFGLVASSPVEKVKEAAMIKRLKEMGKWNEKLEESRVKQSGGNQIVYSGTAFFAFNHFARQFKKWHTIISSKGDPKKLEEVLGDDQTVLKGFSWKDYAIIRIPYNYIPEGLLDPGIVAQAKAKLSNSQFLTELGACFIADSDGFYKRSVIEAATTNKPILTSAGNSIQFNPTRTGKSENKYVIAVDPAADQDNAAIVVLEMYPDHRRIVYCWTTNRQRYNKLKKNSASIGIVVEDDYYRYIANKIKQLMSVFSTERIVMDKNGGGIAIAEALSSKILCSKGEYPIFEIVDPDDPKPNDLEKGIHILELLTPNQEFNSEANHGMLKDLQEKVLLFPAMDVVEIAKNSELDNLNNIKLDTYEDLVEEIEELKNEMTSIVVIPSPMLGRESFDTPTVKLEGSRRGRARKDRYSALLYANYYARSKNKNDVMIIDYKPVGASKDTISKVDISKPESMYYGPGLLKFKGDSQKWNNKPGFRYFTR